MERKDAIKSGTVPPIRLVKLPRRVIEQHRGVVAALLLLCSVIFLFGILRELQWRLDLRNKGYKAAGIITSYDGPSPTVEFKTYLKQKYETPTRDRFSLWTRPKVGSAVDVFYDPADPGFLHIGVKEGFARFEWLTLPAVLALLFLNVLRLGLTMLLFYGPHPSK